jgi:hypothetical protein
LWPLLNNNSTNHNRARTQDKLRKESETHPPSGVEKSCQRSHGGTSYCKIPYGRSKALLLPLRVSSVRLFSEKGCVSTRDAASSAANLQLFSVVEVQFMLA